MIARRGFGGRMLENGTLITVMNLSGEVLKVWHSCGLSKNSFLLPAPWSFIIGGTIQRVVESMIRNIREKQSIGERERAC